MKLVIAEKPSVGASIAAVLGANEKRSGYFEGSGYLVSWCIGHLISLADAATYNEQYRKWKYDDLPIVPQDWQFTVASGKEQQFSVLKDLMQRSDVSEIVNACDSGREGELIFRFVYEQVNCQKPFSRLWISSMEESAIREGFSSLKDGRGYDNLYQSALCRAKADWLIGMNATRLYSLLYLFLGFTVLSTYYLQSVMRDRASMTVGILRSLVVSGLLLYVLPVFWGISGVWLALPISECVVAVLAAFFLAERKDKK